MLLLLLHKNGSVTELKNYRGITLANFISVIASSWYTHLLQQYAWKHDLLPEGQSAAKGGVQTRDMLSFLSQAGCWAGLRRLVLSWIKRDQAGGYDRVSEQGWADAVVLHSLPQTTLAFALAFKDNATCSILTAYGPTSAFKLPPTERQGLPPSPIHFCLIMGMIQHWANAEMRSRGRLVVMRTLNAEKGLRHNAADDLTIELESQSFVDDSLAGGITTENAVIHSELMERGENVYGCRTDYQDSSKTCCHQSEKLDPHAPDRIPIVSGTVTHTIPVLPGAVVFLRTSIDDPNTMFSDLMSKLVAYELPQQSVKFDLPVLLRILKQAVCSKLASRLEMQPILPKQAEALDTAMIKKLSVYISTMFPLSTAIMQLPIHLHGAGMESFASINAVSAIGGLVRDLTHKVPLFKKMAHITLATWSCEFNKCANPLDTDTPRRHFSHLRGKIPHAWITAFWYLRHTGLKIGKPTRVTSSGTSPPPTWPTLP